MKTTKIFDLIEVKDFTRLEKYLQKNIRINEIVLFPSAKCNIKCKHCSYLCKSIPHENITINRFKDIIDEAIKKKVKRFIIIGREPLAEIDRTLKILEYLTKKKIRFGIVTNGTLIEKNIKRLKKFKFFYFDVSIDGTEKYNDITRGKGTFKKAKKGIELVLKNKLSDKVFISSTIMSYNYKSITSMIKEFNSINVYNFCLGLYVYTGHNPKEWILKKEQLYELIDNLKKLNYTKGQIIIDIHTQLNHYWNQLIKDGIINKNKIKIDSYNNTFFQIPDTKIFLKNSMLTTTFLNTSIVTADGYYLDDYEYEAYLNYKDYALGNIKNESLSNILKKVKKESPKRFIQKIKKYKSTKKIVPA